MTIIFLKEVMDLDNNHDIHLARLLILFSILSTKEYGKTIVGLTKVAKLDFLLRYPTALEKAMEIENKPFKKVNVKNHEKTSVESKMIRFKFGPWDHRYWSFLSILSSKKLIKISKIGDTNIFQITEKGKKLSEDFIKNTEFDDYVNRSKLISTHFGKLTATTLMNKMYVLRPELKEMEYGEKILI